MKRTITVLAIVLALAACADTGQKQGIGTVLGGIGGGLAGSTIGGGKGRLVAVGAGTLLGAFVGSEVGKSLDRADQLEANRAANAAFEYNRTGEVASWRNPDSGNSGTVTPIRTYQTDSGQHCREYQQTIVVDGRSEQAYGTACRQVDGSWRLAS